MVQNIIKRDGRVVAFDVDKIADAIFKAVKNVGGDDRELATRLAHTVSEYLSSKYSDYYPTVEQVQDEVEKVLIEAGHAKTAKAYILFRADRTRAREMDSSLMKVMEDLTFKKSTDSDMKRENANINTDTAMGTMLKYGSESSKAFTDLYVLDPEQSKAHAEGDIHIHDKDFYNLTETCMTAGTRLIIKRNGKIHSVEASYFDEFFVDNNKAVIPITGIKVLSKGGKFINIKNCMRRQVTNLDVVYRIISERGELLLTEEHIVPVLEGVKEVEKPVKLINAGDKLIVDVEDGKSYSAITSVKKEGYLGYVYDIETDDHYFNANGFIIHNCCQIGLEKLLAKGFHTGHGWLRTPGSIGSAASLACIAIQSNQNDQHKIITETCAT